MKKRKPRRQSKHSLNQIKGVASLYRSVGLIGSITTSILSFIWILLCIVAILVLFVGPPYEKKGKGKSFFKQGIEESPQDFNSATFFFHLYREKDLFLPPKIIFDLLVIYMILSINHLLASMLAIFEFIIWRGRRRTRRLGQYWAISTIIMCLYELIFGILFYKDATSDDYPSPAADTYQTIAFLIAALSMKAFIIWPFCMVLAITLLILPFANRKNCPV